MEVIDIFGVLRRRVYLILALTIVTTIAGYGISFVSALIPEKYDASAIVMVRPNDPDQDRFANPKQGIHGFSCRPNAGS